jgi:hypothetical protein
MTASPYGTYASDYLNASTAQLAMEALMLLIDLLLPPVESNFEGRAVRRPNSNVLYAARSNRRVHLGIGSLLGPIVHGARRQQRRYDRRKTNLHFIAPTNFSNR